MRRRLSLSAAIILLVNAFAVVAPAVAPGDLKAMLERSSKFRASGNYAAALAEAQKLEAAVKMRFGTNHENYAVALNTLANVYESQGKYAEAEAYNTRALAIVEARLGKEHLEVATTLNNLADVSREQGKNAEAEVYLKRALAIFEAKRGKSHP